MSWCQCRPRPRSPKVIPMSRLEPRHRRLVITARDWFCFYLCLICDLSGGWRCLATQCIIVLGPAVSQHQELNSGLRCEGRVMPCYQIWARCQSQHPSHWSRDSGGRKQFMTGAQEKAPPGHLQHVTPGTWPPASWLLRSPDLLTSKGFNSLNFWPLAFTFEVASSIIHPIYMSSLQNRIAVLFQMLVDIFANVWTMTMWIINAKQNNK